MSWMLYSDEMMKHEPAELSIPVEIQDTPPTKVRPMFHFATPFRFMNADYVINK